MSNKPNVLLIMTDQQRWDTLGCYGNKVIETANLDWIASEGTVFESAYSCTPSCIPARASLMTGMDPWNVGILGMGKGQGPMSYLENTLPEQLARAGYHTQGVGKMHFHPQRSLFGFHHTVIDESARQGDPGFISDYRRWFDHNKTGDYGFTDHGIDWNSWMARPYHAPEFLHPTNWTVNESIRFVENRDPNKPFFLKMSFARPHSPYDAPAFYYDIYDKKDIPKPHIGEWSAMHDVKKDAAFPDAWRGKRSEEEIRRGRIGYYGNIHHIDLQIGRLLMYLKKKGQLDNTLILFTSDHGDMMGDHHMWRKTYAYEGSTHIPLIVKLPKSMKSAQIERSAAPVCLQDIMPTILDVAKVDIPDTVDGRSMLPLMQGRSTSWREFVHGEHSTCYSELQEMQYVTDGRWKYIWFPRIGTEQLFDLSSDPGECVDLASNVAYSSELIGWREKLIAVLSERDAGLTDNGALVCQAGKPYHVSPKYKERIERAGGIVK
ncbi:arylsulfatase [Paenibacillus sp. UNC451MF]|uniref:arylsulfatase n=1 Tax=Paenibacillus sp. UNC451MF TaxID=1449063 RepID=UPI000561EF9B|nr:arylsulfatase [Paenibacillus sp. UNC451MF]